ncbi:membrane protein [hydrothermal vent metagenome]|uniref:Membrane protein n=1 Tax=hydrothermal vent metagenome TaxID=652676 RepID=A0A1W1BV21_9ZZZZ
MDENNELSDIVLNKDSASNSNKKIILAIATLGVVLIIVVMLMNSINSKGTSNLPHAALPPKPKTEAPKNSADDIKEPLFEDVPVVQEEQEETNLDHIAKKLKEESNTPKVETKVEPKIEKIEEPVKTTPIAKKEKSVKKQHKVIKEKVIHKKVHKVKKETKIPAKKQKVTPKKVATNGHGYFVQVGSFSKYEPNKKFLNSITKLGYKYSYHKAKNINKVLVGPFNTREEANKAKALLRSKVVRGAFLVKL